MLNLDIIISNVSDTATNIFLDFVNWLPSLLFPFATEIKKYGLSSTSMATTDCYAHYHAFDFIDCLVMYFVNILSTILNLFFELIKKLTDLTIGQEENGIPIRGLNHLIGQSSNFHEYEVMNKFTRTLRSLDPFSHKHLIETLSKVPGGLDVPQPAVTGFNMGVHNQPEKLPASYREIGNVFDENVPSSMQKQGNLFESKKLKPKVLH